MMILGKMNLNAHSTFKPSLATTCLERPHLLFPVYILKPVLKEPVHKDHLSCFPRVVFIYKFHCRMVRYDFVINVPILVFLQLW